MISLQIHQRNRSDIIDDFIDDPTAISSTKSLQIWRHYRTGPVMAPSSDIAE